MFKCWNSIKSEEYDVILNKRFTNTELNSLENRIKFSIRVILDLAINKDHINNLENEFIIKDFIYSNGDEMGVILENSVTNKIWILFRGTYKSWQLKEEIKFIEESYYNGICHKGFLNIYKSLKLKDFILKNPNKSFIVAGHSLGGALASLLSIDLHLAGRTYETYIFGSPRICSGNITSLNLNIYNIQNVNDVIPNAYLYLFPFIKKITFDNFGKSYYYDSEEGCSLKNHSLISYYNNIDLLFS